MTLSKFYHVLISTHPLSLFQSTHKTILWLSKYHLGCIQYYKSVLTSQLLLSVFTLLDSVKKTQLMSTTHAAKFQAYLFDEPLAEGRSDPLSGMDTAVDPHGLLLMTTPLSNLTGHDLSVTSLVILHVTLLWFFSNLKHIKWPALIRLANGEQVYQMRLCSVYFKHPALNLEDREVSTFRDWFKFSGALLHVRQPGNGDSLRWRGSCWWCLFTLGVGAMREKRRVREWGLGGGRGGYLFQRVVNLVVILKLWSPLPRRAVSSLLFNFLLQIGDKHPVDGRAGDSGKKW